MRSSAILERVRSLLDTVEPFGLLPEAERDAVLPHLSVTYFAPGEVVVEQGSSLHRGLYIVESGMVRLMDVDRQQLVGKVGEGDTFGAFGLLKGGGSVYEAKAVEPTVAVRLDAKTFQRLYDQHEPFAAHFEHEAKQYLRRLGTSVDVTGGLLLFNARLDQLQHRRPVTCTPETTAQEAAHRMQRENVDAVLVLEGGTPRGVLTDADLRTRLVAPGRPADTPVRALMSSPVHTLPAEATLFEAITSMIDRRLHRVAVVAPDGDDGDPAVVALLTDRDLAHYRGQDPLATIRYVESAPTPDELAGVRTTMNELLLRLYRQGVAPEQLNQVMSSMYDAVAVRALELVERRLRTEAPQAAVTLPWVWLRLGSGGRREISLTSEQHNALLYANPSSDEEGEQAEAWFNKLAEGVNDVLAGAGFAPSGIVAREARWRKSMRDWRKTYREWILQSDQEALEAIAFFFDLRGIYGDLALVDELKRDMEDALNVQALDMHRQLLALMTANAMNERSPLAALRRFLQDRFGEHRQKLDLRERGIVPVVDAARILALELRYFASADTFARLRHAAAQLPELTDLLEETLEAYRFLLDFRLEDQLRAVEAGEAPDNVIDSSLLTNVQRNLLRSAFQTVGTLQEALGKRYPAEKR